MPTKNFVCEKYVVKDETPEYYKLFVYEKTFDNGLEVIDITAHASEELADDWLKTQWNLKSPPKVGERLEFEAESPY
jgi:hypothetical protein